LKVTTMVRSSRRRTAAPAFPNLPEGIQVGLRRLVSDNATTVAQMLNMESTGGVEEEEQQQQQLCEKCALVMKQQQLSPSSFLARFFEKDMLSAHAQVLGKSAKGSAPTLADRIAGEWAKNKGFPKEETPGDSNNDDSDAADPDDDAVPKNDKKRKSAAGCDDSTEALAAQKNHQEDEHPPVSAKKRAKPV
jgi:hypothetical protein